MIRRLSQFIKNQQISVRAFEASISASDGMIRRAINNNSDIQSKWLSIIADNYPSLSLDWLITGRGFMLRSESTQPAPQSIVYPVIQQNSSGEAAAYYNMYKTEREENKILNDKIAQMSVEIGTLKAQLNQVEQQESQGLEKSEESPIAKVVTLKKDSSKQIRPASSANAQLEVIKP